MQIAQPTAYSIAALLSDTEENDNSNAMIQAIAAEPTNLWEAIKQVHAQKTGHRGVKSTWEECQRTYPNAHITFQAVKNFVQDCPTCAKIRDTPQDQHALVKALPVYHARAVTHVDVLTLPLDTHNNRYCFVYVNAFTKYTLIYPAKDKTAESTAITMLQHDAVVGITECIWTDNG